MHNPVDTPIITVITVVYNSEQNIESTITSVLNYNYDHLRYVIIDGGSTDGTVGIINKYAEKLSIWISEKDSGIYDAMNKGWAVADGNSYILYLGAGDRLISLPLDMTRYTANDVVYGDVHIGADTLFKSNSGWRLKVYNAVHHQALLIHKSLHPAPPFDLRYRVYADFDFNQRLLKKGVTFCYSNLFKSFAEPGGISEKTDIAESLSIIQKNFGLFWALLALGGFAAVQVLPFLRRLRPLVRLC